MWKIIEGDVRVVLKTLPDNHFDAVLSDPPYGLSFMGRTWDYDVPSAMVWGQVERVLKPGASAVIFGGTRTWHRMTSAVEDGGFEIRDQLLWIYGSGFPKSLDVSKAIDKMLGANRKTVRTPMGPTGNKYASGLGDSRPWMEKAAARGYHEHVSNEASSDLAKQWQGYGTALKPAVEPAVLARKYLEGTVAENAAKWGSCALAIDASRIGLQAEKLVRPAVMRHTNAVLGKGLGAGRQDEPDGRWPSNVILDEDAAAMLDAQTGENTSRFNKVVKWEPIDSEIAIDAMRFFYSPKADRYQREAGLADMPKRKNAGRGALREPRPGSETNTREGSENSNTHPTVKPIDLIRYFARMILPPPRDTPRRILVPYAGVSSEMIGCLQAGWDEVVGIEREAEYIAIAEARLRNGGVMSSLMDRKMRKRKVK